MTASWTIHTEVFDGPLDLLLYLVRRDGVDIRTVPMAKVADAYLDFLDQMRELNLSVASDYLLMAATLTHLSIEPECLGLSLDPQLPDEYTVFGKRFTPEVELVATPNPRESGGIHPAIEFDPGSLLVPPRNGCIDSPCLY